LKYPDSVVLRLGDTKVHFTKIHEFNFNFHYEQTKNNNTYSISKEEFLLRFGALLMLGYTEVPVCLICGLEGFNNEKSKCDWSLMGTHHWILPSTGKDSKGVKQI